jgi:hypothetical protein
LTKIYENGFLTKEGNSMKLTGLHLLLTYQCNFECDHCFVWGSPWQSGVMSLPDLQVIFDQAGEISSLRSVYFEGGEPFLYYAVLREGVRQAYRLGYQTGIVTNAFWANSLEDATANLQPFSGLLQDLSVSSDLFHWSEPVSQQVRNACSAAEKLGIPVGTISIAQPEVPEGEGVAGQHLESESGVMYRGRAAARLAWKAVRHPWEGFDRCPYEDLVEPGRVHLDPLGYVHICQGICLGNIYQMPLRAICEHYNPNRHPITAPLLQGGPAELVRVYNLPLREAFADACHLCYSARSLLLEQFPVELGPAQMYGVEEH